MKTTVIIPDPVFRNLKRHAMERGETLSNIVTECVRQGLGESHRPRRPFRLPSFSVGRLLVDVTNRDALYDVLDAERHALRQGKKKG